MNSRVHMNSDTHNLPYTVPSKGVDLVTRYERSSHRNNLPCSQMAKVRRGKIKARGLPEIMQRSPSSTKMPTKYWLVSLSKVVRLNFFSEAFITSFVCSPGEGHRYAQAPISTQERTHTHTHAHWRGHTHMHPSGIGTGTGSHTQAQSQSKSSSV